VATSVTTTYSFMVHHGVVTDCREIKCISLGWHDIHTNVMKSYQIVQKLKGGTQIHALHDDLMNLILPLPQEERKLVQVELLGHISCSTVGSSCFLWFLKPAWISGITVHPIVKTIQI
jgi:hypothetical protein